MRTLRAVPAPVKMHQGGWDEILVFVGGPVLMFIVLRLLGLRKERREQRERSEGAARE